MVAEAPEFPLSADPIPLTLAANTLHFVPFSIRGDVSSFISVTPQNNGQADRRAPCPQLCPCQRNVIDAGSGIQRFSDCRGTANHTCTPTRPSDSGSDC